MDVNWEWSINNTKVPLQKSLAEPYYVDLTTSVAARKQGTEVVKSTAVRLFENVCCLTKPTRVQLNEGRVKAVCIIMHLLTSSPSPLQRQTSAVWAHINTLIARPSLRRLNPPHYSATLLCHLHPPVPTQPMEQFQHCEAEQKLMRLTILLPAPVVRRAQHPSSRKAPPKIMKSVSVMSMSIWWREELLWSFFDGSASSLWLVDLGTRVRCSDVDDKLDRELGRAVDLYNVALPRKFWHFRVSRSEPQWKANYNQRARHGTPFTWCDFVAVHITWFAIPSISLVFSRTLSFSLEGMAVIDIHKDRPLQRSILCIEIDSLGLVCSIAKPSPIRQSILSSGPTRAAKTKTKNRATQCATAQPPTIR